MTIAAGMLVWGIAWAADAPAPGGLALRPVANGNHSGIEQRGQRVIRTAEEWKKLWADHSARSSDKTPPDVDFSKDMVLAAFMGRCTTGGYSVAIPDARVVGKKLVVSVVETAPGRGRIRNQLITSPFVMVAVKTSSMPVEWKVTSAAQPPDGPAQPADPTLR
jgi:hypothetical protein